MTENVIDNRRGDGLRAGSWASHLRATILLGLPLVGAQLAQMAIGVTDVVMIGRLGATELAAGVLATQAFFFFYIFGAGFTNAVMPLAAYAHGRGDPTSVRRSVRMGLWVVALFGLASMLPLWHIEAILLMLGQEPEIARLAGVYMHVCQWALFPALFILGLRSFYTAIGRAQIILWSTLAGTLLNGVLDYAFIFGRFGAPALGIAGAAAASLGTNLLMLAVLVATAQAKPVFRAYDLFVRFWRPDREAFLSVVRLGVPISLTIIAEVGLFTATSLMMGWLGTVTLAAHGIAMQLISIAFMIPLGLSQAATVRVGQAHGRANTGELGRASAMVLAVSFAVATGSALVFWLVPGPLVDLFLDPGKPQSAEVAATAASLLAVAAAFQIFDGLQIVASGLLRGLKDTRVPMLLAVASYWLVGAPAAYVLGFVLGYGGVGVWTGLALGIAASALLGNWRFHRREAYGLV